MSIIVNTFLKNFSIFFYYISTRIKSSPMHLIFCQGISISPLCENILNSLLLPGTIIDVILPVSKSAQTSCTYPKSFSIINIYNFFMFKIHTFINHNSLLLFSFLLLYSLKNILLHINRIIFIHIKNKKVIIDTYLLLPSLIIHLFYMVYCTFF